MSRIRLVLRFMVGLSDLLDLAVLVALVLALLAAGTLTAARALHDAYVSVRVSHPVAITATLAFLAAAIMARTAWRRRPSRSDRPRSF